MAYLNVYTGAALATYNRIQDGIENIYINKVYASKTARCLFYINKKGFMHVLTPGKTTLNGRVISYHLSDELLTKDNTLRNTGNYTKELDTVEALQAVVLELTA